MSADSPPWGALRNDPVETQKADWLGPYLGPVRSVLDCGCGGGDFLRLVANGVRFERAVGMDIADNAIARARRTGLYTDLVLGDIEMVGDHVRGPFDLVLLCEVLYYMKNYLRTVARVADELIAPGGLLFIALAMGRGYFWRRDLAAIEGALEERAFHSIFRRTIDYTVLGIPRRRLLFYAQTHKTVLLYRRGESAR